MYSGRPKDCFALFPDLNNFETASIDDERMIRFNGSGKWRLALALTGMNQIQR
jgi:hypothetical protein